MDHPKRQEDAISAFERRGFAALAAALVMTSFSTVSSTPRGLAGPMLPFAPFAGSSWRTPIPAGAKIDPNSDAMVAQATRSNGVNANLVEFGIPIFHATPDTPRYPVRCTSSSHGPCPFDGIGVPVPDGARPHSGSDGALVIVDDSARKSFEFWQARRSADGWTTSFGAVNDLDGSGWGAGSTASGASRLAGVILLAEIAAGAIPHALALQSNSVCNEVFRRPAISTDGTSSRPDCIPEGARVRLDPAADLNSLELNPAERAIGHALQTYGGYVMDRGGAPLSISFELAPDADAGSIGHVWEQAGLRWDYDDLPGVPWHQLQVLAESDMT